MELLRAMLMTVVVSLCLLHINGTKVYGVLKSSDQRRVADVNENGPYLGLVIPNAFELYPFLDITTFTLNTTIDISGRRFYVGSIEGQKVIAVMTGLGMLNAGITTQLLLTVFSISGVLHYGIAGNADDELNIGDITIPRHWAHTGLWEWERYDGSTGNRANFKQTKGFKDDTLELGCLQFGDYNNPFKNGSNFLGKLCYDAEEVYPVTGTPEITQQEFWVPVDELYYSIAKEITSKTCLTNNVSFIAFRALSDLAGGSDASNEVSLFFNLASTNAVIVLVEFIRLLSSSDTDLAY